MRRSELLFGFDNFPTDVFLEFLRDVRVPGDDLQSIDDALQSRFFQRDAAGNPLERWELQKIKMSCPEKEIRQHLTNCGFLNETKPSSKVYDYAGWPGALVARAAERLYDLVKAWTSGVRWTETIVFVGKRPLHPDKESYEQCCKTLGISTEDGTAHESWRRINPQTELDMMRWVWENFRHPVRGKTVEMFLRPVVFVDAPMKPPVREGGPPVRPSTEDTIWCWLDNFTPVPGSMLLSSGAPYGMAQDEAFLSLLGQFGFKVETFGHKAPDLPIEIFMREVAGCVNRIRRVRGK